MPVLTVPMRNGNSSIKNFACHSFRFLPYLWGMETRWRRRNFWTWRRFLPYLWGMETWSYYVTPFTAESSYRTYEEWKQENRQQDLTNRLGSYRTYEEWKPRLEERAREVRRGFLPYLWGMETCVRLCTKRISTQVLTVPMRNGNFLSCFG